MSTVQVVTKSNLGKTFDIGGIEPDKVNIKAVSTDAGNLLAAGTDAGAFLDKETVQDAIGEAIAAGAGVTYDDAMNAIGNAFANLAGTTTATATSTLTADHKIQVDVTEFMGLTDLFGVALGSTVPTV